MDGSLGLTIIDVSNAAAPALMASIDLNQLANGVHVVGSFAYVAVDNHADPGRELVVIDVSDPIAPKIVGSAATPHGGAWDVAVSDGKAYVVDRFFGLVAFDVTRPTSPQPAGSVEMISSGASRVDVAGNHVYVATERSGVVIMRIGPPTGHAFLPHLLAP